MLTNTERRALRAAERLGGVTAFELFRMWYRTSKQPGKKVAGIFRTLRSMHRRGLLNEVTDGGEEFTSTRFIPTVMLSSQTFPRIAD